MADLTNHDWFLQAWALEKGKKQSDLVTELGWLKNTAHRIWHGKQPYRRDVLNMVAQWLDLQPYELLMPPAEAIALRSLRQNAAAIVAAGDPERFLPAAPTPIGSIRKTGSRR